MIDDVENIIDKMTILKSLGVQFALDDFGTGYSSLSNLKRLPIDQLKIDQSFIHNLTTDCDEFTMVKTIIGMGNNLGLDVIAEGVETKAQLECLVQNRCHWFQGYFLEHPVPIGEFDRFLQQEKSCVANGV